MKNHQHVLSEIDATCRELADPEQSARYARYFTEGYDAYGVDHKAPAWLQARQRWFDSLAAGGLPGFLELGKALFSTGKYEHGALAIWFAAQFRDRIGPRAFTLIGQWFDGGVRNWAHTDVICGELLSPRLGVGAVKFNTLAKWPQSPHKFKRRAVPVAMLGLLPTGSDCQPWLDFLRPLVHDPEKVVQQGLGWFLRETWKQQPKPVEAFLLEFRDSGPRVIFQYATEKMTPAEKGRFRRQKPKRGS